MYSKMHLALLHSVAMMPLVSIQLVGLFYERKQKRTKETTVVYGDYDIVELWEGEHAK